jgi:Tol biopolymer transport system component
VTAFDIPGHSPHWSPSGDWIAFLDSRGTPNGPMRVMRPDGSEQRLVTPLSTQRYSFGMDWSADEQWLVGANVFTQRIEIVNVQNGLTLPLPFTGGMTAPTWKR